MPMKGAGQATDPRWIDSWDGGFGWIAHPEEEMQRASHALAGDDGVWVIDPVDASGVDDRLVELGDVTGVVVLLDRHERDAATIANRHDVSVHVPGAIRGVAENFDAPVERVGDRLPGTNYRVQRVANLPFWREWALFDGGTLVVADAVGTAEYFLAGDERLGVNPALRLIPPRDGLGGLAPERVLVGHGEGIMADAATALDEALSTARRRVPRAYANALASILR